MSHKNKEHKRIYDKGFQTGSRIKGGHTSFVQLMDRYPKLRKEYNKRVRKAIEKALKNKK